MTALSLESQRTRARFGESNPLVLVTLGLLAGGKKLDAILARHTVPLASTPEHDAADLAGIDMMLGLIAFKKRLEESLTEAKRVARAGARRAPIDKDSLLR